MRDSLPRGAPVGPGDARRAAGERAALRLRVAAGSRRSWRCWRPASSRPSGCVLIDEYDPRVQSVHCKRIARFVPHDPLPLDEPGFERYIGYRAALWNIDPVGAVGAREAAARTVSKECTKPSPIRWSAR